MKTLKVKVLKPFVDRYTGQKRKAGDVIEITDARFREIKRSGAYVEAVKATPVKPEKPEVKEK